MWRSGTIRLAVLPIQSVGPQRNMATLKDISLRLKSVKNIQKITKSMKMVSAAKYAKAERDLKPARPYGEGAQSFYKAIDDQQDAKDAKPKRLLVLMTSDRGLCGAVHTSISKEAKNQLNSKPADVDMKVICIGDKSKAILQRLYSQHILLSGNEIGRQPPTFNDASTIAQAILNSGYEFDMGHIVYNRFKTVVSYTTSKMPIMTAAMVGKKEKMTVYDSIDDDVLQSYTEYSLVSLLYYALKECATSEQSSRMTAMDGASKNSGEMISKLQMQFNRTRQAVITRELIEIISGAAAV